MSNWLFITRTGHSSMRASLQVEPVAAAAPVATSKATATDAARATSCFMIQFVAFCSRTNPD